MEEKDMERGDRASFTPPVGTDHLLYAVTQEEAELWGQRLQSHCAFVLLTPPSQNDRP